jgi:hypothetical protein
MMRGTIGCLAPLENGSRKRIAPHLQPTKLNLGAIVCEAGGLLKHAYFPQGTVLSLLIERRKQASRIVLQIEIGRTDPARLG